MASTNPTRKPAVPVYRPPVVPCVLTEGRHDGEAIAAIDANTPDSFHELIATIRQLIKSYRNRG